MSTSLDADLELLGSTAERHAATMSTPSCVHLSAAIDALTDPLVPPRLSGVDDAATADLAEVLRAVRGRLLHAAQHTDSLPGTLAIGFAARELTCALATLAPDRDGVGATSRSMPGHDGDPARPDRPAR